MRTIKLRKTLGDRMILFVARFDVVSEIDGVALVDMRRHGDSFRHTIERSLALIRDHDSRRYSRLVHQIRWIINQVSFVSMGMDYNPRIRACTMEFSELPGLSPDALSAAYAMFLIHMATEGAILTREMHCDPEFWPRVGRICLTEGDRFVSKLAAIDPMRYGTDMLKFDYDKPCWAWPNKQSGLSLLSRWWRDRHAEPGAQPNGGPATRPGSSSTLEGPTSMS